MAGLTLDGLTFRNADWYSPLVQMPAHHRAFGLDMALAGNPQAAIFVPGSVSFRAARKCSVVNCTVEQLRRGEVSVAVAAALEESGFPSDQLNIEVTEDAVVDPTASADLQALSEMGVQLSVDDVGTNWSSFEPFKRHAISTVKIDGSFVAGLESNQGINRLVVETVIHMAHSLGMSAIVEQVENANQLRIAGSFGADAAQGFFFARPIPAADARAFAVGPDIPVFSRTEAQTLLLADGETAPLDSMLTEQEPEGEAKDADQQTPPLSVPDLGASTKA